MDQKKYKEYADRAPEDEEFDKVRDSLNTINDIKDIKFKPADVEVPDASSTLKIKKPIYKINL
jgi:hypothetical protein